MKKLSLLIPVYNLEDLVIKALDSIPRRDDIEVIVRDDGSTDKSLWNVLDYQETHPELPMTVCSNGVNRGVAYTKNRMLGMANGEYIHLFDSDDYLLTQQYETAMEHLGEADVILFDLEVNDGSILKLTEDSCGLYCAQIARFIRRDFVEGIEFPEHIRAADDWYYANDIMARNPKQLFTGIVAYHYNWPREGSLSDLKIKGLI